MGSFKSEAYSRLTVRVFRLGWQFGGQIKIVVYQHFNAYPDHSRISQDQGKRRLTLSQLII
jgi:hypothetical protein